MNKMTKEELKKRKAELKKIVHAEIVRREVIQFRLEPDNIDKLYRLAAKERKPVGTLVREWITDKINAELHTRTHKSVQTKDMLLSAKSDPRLDKLKIELQKQLNEINKRVGNVENVAHSIFTELEQTPLNLQK